MKLKLLKIVKKGDDFYLKCKIKGWSDLSPRARKETTDMLADINQKLLKKECERMKVNITNNLFKLFVLASNEKCGLGKERISRILKGVNELVINMRDDNDTFFMGVEKDCKRILGEDTYNLYFKDIPFKVLPDNYDLVSKEVGG